MIYDSGDYPESQRRALEAAGWSDFPSAPEAARAAGTLHRHRAVQLCRRHRARSVRERLAFGSVPPARSSSRRAQPRRARASKPCWRRSRPAVGCRAATRFSVIDGDTAASPLGLGAFASRQAVNAGNAVARAPNGRRQGLKQAAAMLKVRARRPRTGRWRRARQGRARRQRQLGEIAHALTGVAGLRAARPAGAGPRRSCDFQPQAMTYTSGTHVCEVAVDIATGRCASPLCRRA